MIGCFVLALVGALFCGVCAFEVSVRNGGRDLSHISDEELEGVTVLGFAAIVIGVVGFLALQIAGFAF